MPARLTYDETLYGHYFFYPLREGYLTASYKSKTIHIVLISKRSHKFIVQLHVVSISYFINSFFFKYFLQQNESRANFSRRVLQTVNQHTECSPRDTEGYYIYSSNRMCRPNHHYVYNTGTTFILDRDLLRVVKSGILNVSEDPPCDSLGNSAKTVQLQWPLVSHTLACSLGIIAPLKSWLAN